MNNNPPISGSTYLDGNPPSFGPDHSVTVVGDGPKGDYFPNFNISGLSPLLSSLVTSAPGLIGGGLSALAQFGVNELNYKRQLKMYEENREYNSPKNQMARFKEAGLNPNLIYGQTNTAQAMPVGSSVAPNFDFLGQLGQNAISSYNQQRDSNINNAINYVKYAIDRTNLGWLPEEKFNLWRQLKKTINNIDWDTMNKHEDAWLKSLEYDLKKINYEYDYNQFQKGFPPDLPPEYRSVVGMISQLLDYIGIIDSETFNKFIFQTN